MVEISSEPPEVLRGFDMGRGYNLTCGPTCTYPILGIGALLVYSFFMREAPSRDRLDEKFAKEKKALGSHMEQSGNLFDFEDKGSLSDKIEREYRNSLMKERMRERADQKRRLQELRAGEKVHGWMDGWIGGWMDGWMSILI